MLVALPLSAAVQPEGIEPVNLQRRPEAFWQLLGIAAFCGACGSSPGQAPEPQPAGTVASVPVAGVTAAPTAGTGSTPVVVPPGPPVAGTATTNAAGTPAVVGAAGTLAGSTAGTSAAAGSAAAGSGSAGSASTDTDTWTAQSNLDAGGKLIVPATGQGYQIETTTFDLQPGQEVFSCYHVQVPNDATFAVGEWDGQMTAGSHHFILYRDDNDQTASGTLSQGGCTMGFGGSTWLYTQGTPRSHLEFPDAVAMELTPHEHVVFDMHYINTGDAVIHAHVTLNINKVKAEKYQKAGSQVSFNVGINVPAHGMQTVGGDCTPVPGANYFIMQTHTHKHATLAVVNRSLNGVIGEELVHTTDWDNPQAHEWHAAPFLNFASGETFHYSCSYQNDSASPITVGTSAATNEMCMAEAYYFPIAAQPGACN
jgi:Copper type II ascorbate-dependent monooxygenase, C-terminal domain